MCKKIWNIFMRDAAVNLRDPLAIFIIIFPVIFAIGINLIVPGINDTTVNVAMVESEEPGRAEFFEQFAKVELLESKEKVEERVGRRDAVFGVVTEGETAVILAGGNEPPGLVDYAKLINVLYESGVRTEDAKAEIVEFGRTAPPIKTVLVNSMLLFISVMAGMLIALNILEEKTDRTVSAVNVAPVSRFAFIFGKSLIGMAFAFVVSAACLAITGFRDISIGQAAIVIAALTVLSMIIGFVQGLASGDVMEAAGSVKLMFLPLLGSVLAYELLSEKWQIFFWWSPFYWAYRANELILSGNGEWPQLMLYSGLILVICAAVCGLLIPRIRKGLR